MRLLGAWRKQYFKRRNLVSVGPTKLNVWLNQIEKYAFKEWNKNELTSLISYVQCIH